MIKLTNPLMHNGRMVPAGSSVTLSEEFETAVVKAGNAVYTQPSTEGAPPCEVPEGVPKEVDNSGSEDSMELQLGRGLPGVRK